RQVRCVSNEEVLDRVVRLAEERKGHPTYRHEPAPFDVVLAGLLPQLPPGRLLDRLIRLDAATGREPPGAIERTVRIPSTEQQRPGSRPDQDHPGGRTQDRLRHRYRVEEALGLQGCECRSGSSV